MTGPSDFEIIRAMRTYGGSFVRLLAYLCDRADPENLTRIKATWPEYWAEYAEIARIRKRRAD